MRRKVERLVGSHYSSAVPGFGPKSFPRGRRGSHRSCGGSIGRAVAIYSEPTSGVRGPDTLWRVPWTPLLGAIFVSIFLNITFGKAR